MIYLTIRSSYLEDQIPNTTIVVKGHKMITYTHWCVIPNSHYGLQIVFLSFYIQITMALPIPNNIAAMQLAVAFNQAEVDSLTITQSYTN